MKKDKEEVTQRRLDADIILRHLYCRNSDCTTCLDDHQILSEKLEWLTDNDSVDHADDFLGIIDLKKLEKQIEEVDAVLDALQAQYRAETGRKHVWFK